MDSDYKIAKWAGWKTVSWRTWLRFVSCPDGSIVCPCIISDESIASPWDQYAAPHIGEYVDNRIYFWARPVEAISRDIAFWHSTLFPLIEERGLAGDFYRELELRMGEQHQIDSISMPARTILGWYTCRADPPQLAAALVTVINRDNE